MREEDEYPTVARPKLLPPEGLDLSDPEAEQAWSEVVSVLEDGALLDAAESLLRQKRGFSTYESVIENFSADIKRTCFDDTIRLHMKDWCEVGRIDLRLLDFVTIGDLLNVTIRTHRNTANLGAEQPEVTVHAFRPGPWVDLVLKHGEQARRAAATEQARKREYEHSRAIENIKPLETTVNA